MVTKMYAVYDVKGDSYSVPFFAPSHGIAVRNFSDLANDKSTTVGRHPSDFKIVHLAEFDDVTGEVVPVSPIMSLGFATDFVRKGVSIHE